MSIAQRLNHIKLQIAATCREYDRDPRDVHLVLVSKNRTSAEIRQAQQAGQQVFAENYVQEALPKIETLKNLNLEWHFIGAIQSNKTKLIAENFSWVHSVSSYKIAQRLNAARPSEQAPLNVCIQVNVSDETTKSGVLPQQVVALAQQVVQLPRLKLRGLMAVPAPSDNVAEQRAAFRLVAELAGKLRQLGINIDTLSMGMSNDYQAAIAENATLLRIGTAVFGMRKPK